MKSCVASSLRIRACQVVARLLAHGPAAFLVAGLTVMLIGPAAGLAAAASPAIAFADGTHVVGADIQPGTYRTRVGSDYCYWERLSGFGGTLDETIANDITVGPAVVTISASDVGFSSTNCGTWTDDLSAIISPWSPIPEGTFIVGTDILPGSYRTGTGLDGCYWQRLSGFGGTLGEIIANDFTDGSAIVTISPSDRGFSSSNCGTWTNVVAPPGSTYHALTPTRILDSRYGTGLSGAFSSHVARTFTVTGGIVPSNATAVTGNLTVTGQSSLGFLFVGPVAMNNPTSSTLNFPSGDDRANAVTVALGAGGTLSVTYAAPTLGQSAQVIFDVTGYFTPDASGASYFPLTPTRILDSRYGTGLAAAFSSHVARTFGTSGGTSGVPASATAITGNLTVTQQTSLGFLYLGPNATDSPTSSTLNFPKGDDRANAVTVAIGAGATLSVTYAAPTLGPTAHVILDVTGYFAP